MFSVIQSINSEEELWSVSQETNHKNIKERRQRVTRIVNPCGQCDFENLQTGRPDQTEARKEATGRSQPEVSHNKMKKEWFKLLTKSFL